MNEAILPERLTNCCFHARATTDVVPSRVPTSEPITFRTTDGVSFQVQDSLAQTILLELQSRRPQSVSFEELISAAASRLDIDASQREFTQQLTQFLMAGYVRTFLDVHQLPVDCVSTVSERPQVSPCTRLQAQGDSRVTNRAHQSIGLDEPLRFLATQLDGTMTIDDLKENTIKAVRSGELPITTGDNKPIPTSQIPTACQQLVDDGLDNLRDHRYLIG